MAVYMPSGVLADHDEVDLLGALVLDRRLDPGEELTGRRLMYWSRAKRALSRMPCSRMPGLTSGMADGAQEDGVVPAQLLDGRIGQGLARPQVAVAAEVVVGQGHR